MDVKGHVTTIGALHIGLGVLGLVLAPVLVGGTVGRFIPQDPASIRLLGVPLGIVGYVIGFIAVLAVILGFGLVRRWSWVRRVSLTLAYSDLLIFPVGTLLGLYTIWTLRQDAAVELFAVRAEQ